MISCCEPAYLLAMDNRIDDLRGPALDIVREPTKKDERGKRDKMAKKVKSKKPKAKKA